MYIFTYLHIKDWIRCVSALCLYIFSCCRICIEKIILAIFRCLFLNKPGYQYTTSSYLLEFFPLSPLSPRPCYTKLEKKNIRWRLYDLNNILHVFTLIFDMIWSSLRVCFFGYLLSKVPSRYIISLEWTVYTY